MDTDNLMAFYEPGKTHLYSLAVYQDGEWRTQYDRETLAEVRAARGEHMQLIPFEDACRMIDDAQMAAYCHAPIEETRENFHAMLNVLPPAKWLRGTHTEAFFVPEPLCADIYNWHVRIGDRFWCLNRSGTRAPESIIAEVSIVLGVEL